MNELLVTITKIRSIRNSNRMNVIFTQDGVKWDRAMTAPGPEFMTGDERGAYVLGFDTFGYIDSLRKA